MDQNKVNLSSTHISAMNEEIKKYILEKYKDWNYDSVYGHEELIKRRKKEIENNTFQLKGITNIIYEYLEEDISIYDPYYGSNEFVKNIVKQFNRLSVKNVYNERNKESCIFDHLTEKFDIIVATVPWGGYANYTNLKNRFEYMGYNTFSQIYPIITNNRDCIIIQKCIYNLKIGGIFQISLPYGILFQNVLKEFRKWLTNIINIESIILFNDDVNHYGNILSCILTITKNAPNDNINIIDSINNTINKITNSSFVDGIYIDEFDFIHRNSAIY